MKTLLYILVISTLFFGCKKYPEDEVLVHLRTPEQRLKHFSPWQVVEYTVDGADSISYNNAQFYWQAPLTETTFNYERKSNAIQR